MPYGVIFLLGFNLVVLVIRVLFLVVGITVRLAAFLLRLSIRGCVAVFKLARGPRVNPQRLAYPTMAHAEAATRQHAVLTQAGN